MVAREQGGEVLTFPCQAKMHGMHTACQLIDEGKSKFLHGMPADPHTTLCLPFVQGTSVGRMQGSRLQSALPLPRGCLLLLPPQSVLSSFKAESVLVPSFLTPSCVLLSTSPSSTGAGSSQLSSQSSQKCVVLSGSTNKALSFHGPVPVALMGISLRSLSPSHPAETQDGSADSRQGRKEGTSHLEVRQVTHRLSEPRLRKLCTFSVFAFEK